MFPIMAPISGMLTNSGDRATITVGQDHYVFMHLQDVVPSGFVAQGTIIGYSKGY